MAVATGTVTSLHRWPVKSLGGEPAGALRLTRRGVAGDRAHVLLHEHKGETKRLTIRTIPRMLQWHAAYTDAPGDVLEPDAPTLPTLTAPDGHTYRWDDDALPQVLADDLGKPVALRRDTALHQDLPCSVLVTTQATLEAVAAALGRDADDAFLGRFRTNVHVTLDAPAFAEEGWEGRTLRIGETELRLLHPCGRCVIPTRDPATSTKDPQILRWLFHERQGLFGINARAAGPARVAVGDHVDVV
jgi:uncharacterized protein YcbX